MVILKTVKDLEKMRKAGEISVGALAVAKESIRPGVSTLYINEQVHEYITSRGAKPIFLGYRDYPASVCISINEEVIHGIPKDRIINAGDIVSIDVGAEYDGYCGDNAATFAAGTISKQRQELIDVTQECLFKAISVTKKGNRIGDISSAVQTYAEEKGYSVVREFTGHGVGRKLHEEPSVPNSGRAGYGPRLAPGMTIAIEPMINSGTKEIKVLGDGWTVVTADGQCSAHFEMTVAVTDDEGPILLTDWRGVI